ncbi:MAG: hypothetical protein IRY93_10645 [Chthoniobacterales bacterium]|nr:hypothetical protein [Chthoniobacterales bacterium]
MRKLILLLSVLAAPLSAGYTYYAYRELTCPAGGMTPNGTPTYTSAGMSGPSDGTSDYEVRTDSPGSACQDHYLRASADAYYDGTTQLVPFTKFAFVQTPFLSTSGLAEFSHCWLRHPAALRDL